MNDDEMNQHLENGKAAMRGNINTLGIETAAGLWADELAGPFLPADHARIRGAFLAAFEAGMLHQLSRTAKA
jgi:hypothetical protein